MPPLILDGKKPRDPKCIACKGSGRNSEGGRCFPCKGTGVKQMSQTEGYFQIIRGVKQGG